MSDGNEERKEQEERRRWEERKDRDDDLDRNWPKDEERERRDSLAAHAARLPDDVMLRYSHPFQSSSATNSKPLRPSH
jgi:hypothetical protein